MFVCLFVSSFIRRSPFSGSACIPGRQLGILVPEVETGLPTPRTPRHIRTAPSAAAASADPKPTDAPAAACVLRGCRVAQRVPGGASVGRHRLIDWTVDLKTHPYRPMIEMFKERAATKQGLRSCGIKRSRQATRDLVLPEISLFTMMC